MHYTDWKGRKSGMRFARGGRGPGPGHDHEHGHAHRRHGGGGREAGLRRFFAHGDLRLVILNLIAEKPRHGYEIIKAIEDAVGGAYSPSPGVVYPTLTLLEELGYVTTSADGTKKLHAITDEGRAFIEANRPALDLLLERMSHAGPGHGRSSGIVRAMENLKVALRLRMARGSISEEQVDAIAAAIDEAARKVEKT
jgi:DNA-binding PadR family transcriptional regulator